MEKRKAEILRLNYTSPNAGREILELSTEEE
jgi:hypothetical protein